MVLFPGQLQNTSWSLVFTAAGWYLHIYLTDVRLVLILSSLSKKMTFQHGFLWDFFHRFTEDYIWACIDPWEGYDCVGRETLGGHQHLRERVWRAGSHGGALTLVSFTKGVSPPQRSTLNTRPLRPWGSQKNGALSETQQTDGLPVNLDTNREQNKESDSQGESSQCDHMHTSPSNFQCVITHTELWEMSICVI